MEYCSILLILFHINLFIFVWSLPLCVKVLSENTVFHSVDILIGQDISEERQAVY